MSNTNQFEPPKKTPIKRNGITPGPWDIGSEVDEMGRRSISGQGWVHFADVTTRMSGESEDCADGIANANLIAAAPDLLAALQDMVEMIEQDCGLNKSGELAGTANAHWRQPHALAKLAISKAKPTQP